MASASLQDTAPESQITVAALFVDPRGCYAGLPGVDPWGEERDARLYDGHAPVVGHPPCSTWCQLAAVNEKRWGKMRGDDGGCFESCLANVRRVGGVLEHPAFTIAWTRFGLRRPHLGGGWLWTRCGGHVCHVEQGRYGHPARKATWLYAFGVDLRELLWGPCKDAKAWVSTFANHGDDKSKKRVRYGVAAATPPAFRDELLAMARSARRGAR
jgi:hypothetical protein